LLPPKQLPIRQEDYRHFPRREFGFAIEAATGAKIDTFHGLVTNGGPINVGLRLSPAELDSIYQTMIAMRFFDLPEPSPPHPFYWGEESSFETWVVHAGSIVKTLRLPADALSGRSSDDWKRLDQLHNMIWGIVRRKPEWRTLPAREVRTY